jgi:serine/threonine protein kinase
MPQIPEKVGKNYKIIRKLDEGAFGQIFQGINTKTNLEVAVKFEPTTTEHPQLHVRVQTLQLPPQRLDSHRQGHP